MCRQPNLLDTLRLKQYGPIEQQHFGLLEVPGRGLRDTAASGRAEQMSGVATLVGVRHEGAERFYFLCQKADFFHQLTAHSGFRRFAVLDGPARKRQAHSPRSVFVLAQHRHAAILHLRVDQHVVWKADDVIVGDEPVVGKANGLFGHFADRTAAEHDFATHDLPGSEVCHCGRV